jgi:hypothetical protein
MRLVLIILLVLSLGIVGCDNTSNSPEGAVRLFLDGMQGNDNDKLLDAVAPDERSDPSLLIAGNLSAIGSGVLTGLVGTDFGLDLSFSLRDMKFRTEMNGADRATVYVSGRVRLNVLEQRFGPEPFETRRIDGRWYVSLSQD